MVAFTFMMIIGVTLIAMLGYLIYSISGEDLDSEVDDHKICENDIIEDDPIFQMITSPLFSYLEGNIWHETSPLRSHVDEFPTSIDEQIN